MENTGKISLMEKISRERKADSKFDRAHRRVQLFMAAWAAIVVLDRVIGVVMQAYDENQMTYALFGGALLVFAAFLGTRGHIQGAMMVMQMNLAVFLIQFVATCFYYTEETALWSVLFYGVSASVLIVCSLMLFLNSDLESYRGRVQVLKGKKARAPLFYRTNNRLIRNKNR
jgi:hypothetical protein